LETEQTDTKGRRRLTLKKRKREKKKYEGKGTIRGYKGRASASNSQREV